MTYTRHCSTCCFCWCKILLDTARMCHIWTMVGKFIITQRCGLWLKYQHKVCPRHAAQAKRLSWQPVVALETGFLSLRCFQDFEGCLQVSVTPSERFPPIGRFWHSKLKARFTSLTVHLISIGWISTNQKFGQFAVLQCYFVF